MQECRSAGVQECRSAGVQEWGSGGVQRRAPERRMKKRAASEEKILRSYLATMAKPHVTASLYHSGIRMYRFDIY